MNLFSGPRKLIAAAVVAVGLFLAGVTQLFLLRFEVGDVYPAYSSLRADPLGVQVLFESLNQVAENSASRNFRSPEQIPLASGKTLIVCGLEHSGIFLERKNVGRLMDRLASSGGRLVLTFTSRSRERKREKEAAEAQPCPEADDGEDGQDPIEDYVEPSEADPWQGMASLGFDLDWTSADKAAADSAFRSNPQPADLPATIPWRATLWFDLEDQSWQTLYTWQGQPVVAQRPWGKGTVVMVADSYLFSNEALRNHRSSDLLTWLIGSDHHVVFDEFHHGLVRQPGIAGLARQYRLHGVFGALLVVAVLFLWRQSAVFVPPVRSRDDWDETAPAAGRDTAEGLVDLVRRHIESRQLLSVCFDAWHPVCAQRLPESLVSEIRALVEKSAAEPKQVDPVVVYRRICELLKQGKRS